MPLKSLYCKISLMTNPQKIASENKLKNLGLDL